MNSGILIWWRPSTYKGAFKMPKGAQEYFTIVLKLWGQQISGPVLGVISLAAALSAPSLSATPEGAQLLVRAIAWATGSASAVLVFVAHYRAWKTERVGYEAELAKNQRPEIKGELWGLSSRTFSIHNIADEIVQCQVTIFFRLSIRNTRVSTNLDRLSLEAGSMKVPAIFEDVSIWLPNLPRGNAQPRNPELPTGKIVELEGEASLTMDGLHWQKVEQPIDLSGMKAKVVDGFGLAHIIDVEPKTLRISEDSGPANLI
jgi:hypothetical protein